MGGDGGPLGEGKGGKSMRGRDVKGSQGSRNL